MGHLAVQLVPTCHDASDPVAVRLTDSTSGLTAGVATDIGRATTAVRDGDEWVVNGQKVWTSGAQHSQFAILLARTDQDAPKHAGITMFVLPMEQDGVKRETVRVYVMDREFRP